MGAVGTGLLIKRLADAGTRAYLSHSFTNALNAGLNGTAPQTVSPTGTSNKAGMAPSLGGPAEAPISLGAASKYNPLNKPDTGSGKAGTEPSWNKGAENYTPINMLQGGPDLTQLFNRGSLEK